FLFQRPSAKELLKHRFVRNVRKSPRLVERIRERPKYPIKDGDSPRNGTQARGEASDTVKVTRDVRADGTVQASGSRKPLKNAGWDFSIGGSQSTGTVRSALRPPQVKEKKVDASFDKVSQRGTLEHGNHLLSSSGNALQESTQPSRIKDSREPYYTDEQPDDDSQDDLAVSGSGTIVIRTPKGSQSPSSFQDQSTLSSTTLASFDDASTSGTVVFRGQHDDSDSPRTPRSRLGIQERSSSASQEDSASNLAEAKAALQGGARKGNARESSQDYLDAQKAFAKSRQSSIDEESARVISSSAPLSVLLIPSLKEAAANGLEGSAVHAAINSLANMERIKPGSSEIIVRSLLQRLASSKESSMKDLQELAAALLSKGKTTDAEEAQNAKRQQPKDFNSNASLSPLARFLLSRWQGREV
ncbi:unnamed protein product, partial [Linum tenue]